VSGQVSPIEYKLGELRARIDRLPVRPFPVSWLVILGIGYFFAFYDILTLSFAVVSPMVVQLHMTELMISEAVSATLFGYIVGAYFVATISDYWGRRWGLITNALIIAAGSLGSAFSTSPAVLIASRFVTGMGIGAEIAIINTYVAELTPAHIRGRMVQFAYLAGALGFAALHSVSVDTYLTDWVEVPVWNSGDHSGLHSAAQVPHAREPKVANHKGESG